MIFSVRSKLDKCIFFRCTAENRGIALLKERVRTVINKIVFSLYYRHEKDVSLQVLENVYKGTKCFLLFEENEFDEIDKILKTLNEDINYNENAKDRSTLNGCKSIAWSKYKDAGIDSLKTALNFADEAIKDNLNCDVWHFMAGKNLRRIRRLGNFLSKPTRLEQSKFQRAYELSKEPTFGIYLAQLYKELNYRDQALKTYKEIYYSHPESSSINLRLALGFIRLGQLPLAKNCLDFAEKRVPDDSMFLHYKGIYLETSKNFKVKHFLF